MTATKIGHFQPDRVPVDKLVSLFQLDLVFSGITKLDGAFECSFAFGLNNILAIIGFVYQHPNFLLGNLNDTAANREKIEFTIRVALFVTDGDGARNGDRNKWLMTREDGNLALFCWNHDFVDFLVYFFTKQSNKF